MKFLNKENQEYKYIGIFREVSLQDYPFLDILQQKDLSSIKYSDQDEISLGDAFQLKVNIKRVGAVIFFFKKDSFDKDAFVNEVSPLGEISSDNIADVLYKARTLYEIALRFNPLLSIYCPEGEFILHQDCFENISKGIMTFYIYDYSSELVQNKKSQKQKKPKEIKEKANYVTPKEELLVKEKTKFKFSNPFSIIKADKYHYLFALVAAFLIAFTITIAIFDIYLDKKIYIFFLICSVVGMTLNCLIYKDTFTENSIKSMEFIVNVITSLIGIGLGIGGYFIFLSLAKEKPATNPNLLYIIGTPFVALIISSAIAFLLKIVLKKRAK